MNASLHTHSESRLTLAEEAAAVMGSRDVRPPTKRIPTTSADVFMFVTVADLNEKELYN